MIFNGEMVRAILNGRKTQTRREVTNATANLLDLQKKHQNSKYAIGCPYGKPGDRIWVRETWQAIHDSVDEFGHVEERTYAPSIPKEKDRYWHTVYAEHFGDENREDRGFPWRPAIHMPRWASRLTLEITDVRVERLNSISQEDAQAEGMELTGWRPTYSDPDSGGEAWTPYDNFAQLWESIYGEESWKANPWVWVIEFKVVPNVQDNPA
nr:morphogenetic protein [Enterobacter kobei]